LFSVTEATAAGALRGGAAREWLLDEDASAGFTVSALAASPCGGFVALIGGSRCRVCAWEASSRLGPALAAWDTGLEGHDTVGAFLPGGGGGARFLALADEAGTLQVWDLRLAAAAAAAAPRLACSLSFGKDAVAAVSAAGAPRGGALLAAACASGTARVVELAAGGGGGGGGDFRVAAVHTLGGRGAVEQGDKYGRVPKGGGPPRAGSWGARGVALSPDGRALFVLESSVQGGALLAKWRLIGGLEAQARGRVVGAVAPPPDPAAATAGEVWALSGTHTPSRAPLGALLALFGGGEAAAAAAAASAAAATRKLPPRPEAASRSLLVLAGGPDGRALLVDPDTLSVTRSVGPLFPDIPVTALAAAPGTRLLVAGTFASDHASKARGNLRLAPLPGSGASGGGSGGGGGARLRACVLLALLLFVAAAAWGWLALVRVARSELELEGGGGGGGELGAPAPAPLAAGAAFGEGAPAFHYDERASQFKAGGGEHPRGGAAEPGEL
jgi:hypothetical protein